MSSDRWNDEADQDQLAREEVIWRAKEARRKNLQSSLLWGFGVVLALILLALSAHAADRDPYACFGSARYLAQRAGYSCEDLESFCAVARAIYHEAGDDEAAAARLAQARGHSPTVQRLARRMCKP